LPPLETREAKLVTKQDDERPPGQFVSDEHEADCSRFLREVKESIRRRSELGLDRER
jgi:hypothetical protein